VPNDMLIAIALPQLPAELLLEVEPRALFQPRDECFEVRVFVAPFHRGMEMVRHEAVCKIREAHGLGRLQEVRFDKGDMGGDVKQGLPGVSAKGQEIAMRPKIVESVEMFGVGMHADTNVQDEGQIFRLKPEATLSSG